MEYAGAAGDYARSSKLPGLSTFHAEPSSWPWSRLRRTLSRPRLWLSCATQQSYLPSETFVSGPKVAIKLAPSDFSSFQTSSGSPSLGTRLSPPERAEERPAYLTSGPFRVSGPLTTCRLKYPDLPCATFPGRTRSGSSESSPGKAHRSKEEAPLAGPARTAPLSQFVPSVNKCNARSP